MVASQSIVYTCDSRTSQSSTKILHWVWAPLFYRATFTVCIAFSDIYFSRVLSNSVFGRYSQAHACVCVCGRWHIATCVHLPTVVLSLCTGRVSSATLMRNTDIGALSACHVIIRSVAIICSPNIASHASSNHSEV